MFFDNNISVNVIDVLNLKNDKKARFHTGARSFCALSYRKRGNTVFMFNGKTKEALNNSISYVPSDLTYDRISQNEDFIVIHFLSYGKVLKNINVFNPKDYINYEILFNEILGVWNQKNAGFQFKCNSLLNEILYMIQKNTAAKQNDIAQKGAHIIEKKLGDSNFSLCELSKKLKISDAYLRIKFKQKYGMSPKEYQTKLKLEQAKMLIQTGYFSVKDVAHRLGFTNEKYFSQMFKKHFKVSPKNFKSNSF